MFLNISKNSCKIWECHIESFPDINHTKSVLLPKEDAHDVFKNFKRLMKALFITYVDFEWVLIPSTDHSSYVWNTKKTSRR